MKQGGCGVQQHPMRGEQEGWRAQGRGREVEVDAGGLGAATTPHERRDTGRGVGGRSCREGDANGGR